MCIYQIIWRWWSIWCPSHPLERYHMLIVSATTTKNSTGMVFPLFVVSFFTTGIYLHIVYIFVYLHVFGDSYICYFMISGDLSASTFTFTSNSLRKYNFTTNIIDKNEINSGHFIDQKLKQLFWKLMRYHFSEDVRFFSSFVRWDIESAQSFSDKLLQSGCQCKSLHLFFYGDDY